jgi:hypothetical protein
MYSVALGYLKQGDKRSAAYDIGVMSHYISDVGVFGHTMGAYTDWGAEVHHSDYENAIESLRGTLSLPGGQILGSSSAYDATLSLARYVTFGHDLIQTNIWMDAHYDFSDATFKAGALASVYASVSAVASAIDHLMTEAQSTPTPTPSPEPTPEPAPVVTPQVPWAPTGLSAAVQKEHITLTWARPANDGGSTITNYLVFRSPAADQSSGKLMATLSNTTLTWTDVSAEKGQTYHYWVLALNSVGQSEMSVSVIAKVPAGLDSLVLMAIALLAGLGATTGGLLAWRSRKGR